MHLRLARPVIAILLAVCFTFLMVICFTLVLLGAVVLTSIAALLSLSWLGPT